MRRLITTLILLTICIPELSAQHTLDSALLALERQSYACKSDSDATDFLCKKLSLSLAASNFSRQTLEQARRIDFTHIRNKEEQKRFLWNASLIAQLNGDIPYAANFLRHYQEVYPDSGIQAGLLAVLINNGVDTVELNRNLAQISGRDTGLACLSCLNEVLRYERKHKKRYLISSVFVPGLGTALNGDAFKGMNSFLINGALAYGVYALCMSNDYIDALLVASSFGLKFYLGNLKLTNKVFSEKEAKIRSRMSESCSEKVEKILSKYPLGFR